MCPQSSMWLGITMMRMMVFLLNIPSLLFWSGIFFKLILLLSVTLRNLVFRPDLTTQNLYTNAHDFFFIQVQLQLNVTRYILTMCFVQLVLLT